MSRPPPPLNALRAFEAAARHLSVSKAALELHVTPAALSHQIKGLEDFLGLKLFHRRPRAIALTDAGQLLYPGLHAAFIQVRQAVASLDRISNNRILVVSAPPGFTAKWLAPRLYRFLMANPEIDARISANMSIVNFASDGVDVAVRNMRIGQVADSDLLVEKLIDIQLLPVCSPKLLTGRDGLKVPEDLKRFPLIHDESHATVAALPTWADWIKAAGVDGVDVSRGLRFNSADHALEATAEGAGVLLAHRLLAYDDLRTGRLVAPFDLELPSERAIYFVCPKGSETRPNVMAFRAWLKEEVSRLNVDVRPARHSRHRAQTGG
jgi:LysR family transcriptional regulator, glycine cleavage system transcriptional activator